MWLKQKQLNRWFWRWHIIGGLICLPIILLLSISGIFYLFKADYNQWAYSDALSIQTPEAKTDKVSYQAQLDAVGQAYPHRVMQVFLPANDKQSVGFRLHSRGHAKDIVYTNPYTGEVVGEIRQKQTVMYKIRKLHGEILLDTPGTLVVELVSSWFIVLILTGIYIWWPAKKFSLAGFFTIRSNQSRRIFWRDLHAVFGFWLSLFMLVILAGGMPWTDVFGKNLKWVQAQTQTGYPEHWRSSKGLYSWPRQQQSLSIDAMVAIARQQRLEGKVVLKLPADSEGVFSIANRAFWLRDQKVLHFDQYSGELIKALEWKDVGILMELRQVAMRLHQGEYGLVNWSIVLLVALLFTISSIAGLVAYCIRKPKGRWGLPEVPANFTVGYVVLTMIIALGLLFPLFGLSLVAIVIYDFLAKKIKRQGSPPLASDA